MDIHPEFRIREATEADLCGTPLGGTVAGRRMTPALLLQPSQGGKRGWFEFDALACAWVKTASLLKCPFEAEDDPLVTNASQDAPFSRKDWIAGLE